MKVIAKYLIYRHKDRIIPTSFFLISLGHLIIIMILLYHTCSAVIYARVKTENFAVFLKRPNTQCYLISVHHNNFCHHSVQACIKFTQHLSNAQTSLKGCPASNIVDALPTIFDSFICNWMWNANRHLHTQPSL